MKKSIQITLLFSFVILAFFGGISFAGLQKKKVTEKGPDYAKDFTRNYSLLNPIIPHLNEVGKDYSELRSFRPLIEKYIKEVQSKNPDIYIAYYFRDLNDGLWTGINERETFSPASLFKLPLMIALLKKAESDPEILKMSVKYDKKQMAGIEEESGFPKEDGKIYTTEDLLTQMVCYSDNAASLILLNAVGDSSVLKVIKDLNINVGSGYNEKTNFVTVKAYAGIFRILYNASYLNQEMSEKALSLLCQSKFQKGIRGAIPENVIVAHKYGKRDEFDAEHHLKSLQLHEFALVYHERKPFIIGIMTRGANLEVKEKVIHDLTALTYKEVSRQCNEKGISKIFAE